MAEDLFEYETPLGFVYKINIHGGLYYIYKNNELIKNPKSKMGSAAFDMIYVVFLGDYFKIDLSVVERLNGKRRSLR